MLCNSYTWNLPLLLVTKPCLTLCDPMHCNTPGSAVHHRLLESAPKFMSIDLQEQRVCSGAGTRKSPTQAGRILDRNMVAHGQLPRGNVHSKWDESRTEWRAKEMDTPRLRGRKIQNQAVQSRGWASLVGEGNGNPLQCSCLENPRARGGWWAAVYGVAQSRTRLKRLSSSSSRASLEWGAEANRSLRGLDTWEACFCIHVLFPWLCLL